MTHELFCTSAIEAMRKINSEFHDMNVRFAKRITELELYERNTPATEPNAILNLNQRVAVPSVPLATQEKST
jgi:hypothetical protein